MKDSTFLMGSPPTVTGDWIVVLIFINLGVGGWVRVDLETRSCCEANCLVLYMTVVVWEEGQVIGKVEILKLRLECPQYSIVPSCCGGIHDPFDDQEEEKWRHQTSLSNSSLFLETLGHLANMGDPACYALVGVTHQGDELLGYSVVLQ